MLPLLFIRRGDAIRILKLLQFSLGLPNFHSRLICTYSGRVCGVHGRSSVKGAGRDTFNESAHLLKDSMEGR